MILTCAATDYSRPRNVGTLDKTDKSVGEGLVGAPAVCDDNLGPGLLDHG